MSEHQSRGDKPKTVEDYLAAIPGPARPIFNQLRGIAHGTLDALVELGLIAGWEEKLSYGILGFVPAGEKKPFAFISALKDHVGIYPVPAFPQLEAEIVRYRRGKGTLWFDLNEPLPEAFIQQVLSALTTASRN